MTNDDRDAIAIAALKTQRPRNALMIVIVADEESQQFSLIVSEGLGVNAAVTLLAAAGKHLGSGARPVITYTPPEVAES